MGLIDTDLLYRTLDARRVADGKSWRQVAEVMGLSASLFSRLAGGRPPGLDAYIEMCCWLGMPMETFSKRRAVVVNGPLEPALVELLDRHGVSIADQQVLLGMTHAYLINMGDLDTIRLADQTGACHTE
jgi:transcriptional regulator with XRE-family HTH domain